MVVFFKINIGEYIKTVEQSAIISWLLFFIISNPGFSFITVHICYPYEKF